MRSPLFRSLLLLAVVVLDAPVTATSQARLAVADLHVSTPRGFYQEPFALAITPSTDGATLRYTTDGSTPTETTGLVYSGPITISRTTIVRARAFKEGLAPTKTFTFSYLFVSDVVEQVYASPPAGWPESGVNGQMLRYGLNPTLKAQYTTQHLTDALLALPSVSIVTDQSNLTGASEGIYVNALLRGAEWERAASVEWLTADNGRGIQIDAGLRIRGGASRNDRYAMHGFRLFFRGRYGAGKLRFPLHGQTGTGEFQTIDLRAEQNYSWANDRSSTENTAVREVFSRDLMGALGQPTTRSQPVHLYLNGQYWGLYQTEERAQEDYGATYFGGNADDYDVIQTANHPTFAFEVASGTGEAWTQLWIAARVCAASPTNDNYFRVLGRNEFGQPDPSRPVLLDVDNLVTYILLHYYTGDGDGPVSRHLSMERANNWRGMRNRTTRDGFRFFVHDAEHTLRAPRWVEDRVNTSAPSASNRGDFTYSNPEWVHEDLATNLEYRVRFGDLAHRMLFNDGPMTAAKAQAMFDARAAEVGRAIVGDIVRWGQSETAHTLTEWQARIAAIRTGFFPDRPGTLIRQLRVRGLYPALDAPTYSQFGGVVTPGYALTLRTSGQAGAIYYTLDGSDPRAVGGAAAAGARVYRTEGIEIREAMQLRARFRDDQGNWSALQEARFAVSTQAAEQSLAEIAGEVIARRKANSRAARIYTNADLKVWPAPTPPVTPPFPDIEPPDAALPHRGGRANGHARIRLSGEGFDKFVTGNPQGLPPRGERADKFAVDHAFRSPGDRFRGGAGTPHARDERPPVADRPAAPSRPHPRSEVVASSPVAVGKVARSSNRSSHSRSSSSAPTTCRCCVERSSPGTPPTSAPGSLLRSA